MNTMENLLYIERKRNGVYMGKHFLILAKNIQCRHPLERPHRAGFYEHYNLFGVEIRKISPIII